MTLELGLEYSEEQSFSKRGIKVSIMDHFPLPSGKALAHLSVPYLGHRHPDFKYDYLGFRGFPSRRGFKDSVLTRLDGGRTTIEEHTCILQSWCFFGLLIEVFKVFGKDLLIEDFVSHGPNCEPMVTTSRIPSLLRFTTQLTRAMDYDTRNRNMAAVKPLFVTSGIMIRRLFSDDAADKSDWALVSLSTMLIGESVWNALTFSLRCTDSTASPWWARHSLPPKLMKEAGWCPSLVEALLDEEVSQSLIYYLSRIDRRGVGIDHSGCNSNYCTLDKLNPEIYVTQHAENCIGEPCCPYISLEPSRWTQLLEIVDNDQVPLIMVINGQDGADPFIDIISSEDNGADALTAYSGAAINSKSESKLDIERSAIGMSVKQYVCISHVWSE